VRRRWHPEVTLARAAHKNVKHQELGMAMPRKIELIYLLFASVMLAYSTFAAVTGEVVAYQRAGLSETISIETDPEGFWGVVLVYVGIAVVLVLLGIKKYFPPKLYKLSDVGFHSKLSIQQIAFVISFAAIMYAIIFWLARVLASA
jgi:hypothetical protein